ncbi:MAG: sigma-70 family RNA polymerase sigma factor [Chloroflexi bacterium]|nr:sigma-70 family RNA polymerase sigma factor [Chloroflexota bacterium]
MEEAVRARPELSRWHLVQGSGVLLEIQVTIAYPHEGVTAHQMNSGVTYSELSALRTYGVLSDAQLLLLYKNGEAEAIGALYARHAGPLYRFAIRKGLTHSDSDDFVQEVFVKIINCIQGFDAGNANSEHWIHTVKYSVLYDFWRKRGRTDGKNQQIPEDDEIPDEHNDPEDEILEQEIHEAYRRAFRSIPKEDQLEILRGPGRGPGRKTWHAAMARLKESFLEYYNGVRPVSVH